MNIPELWQAWIGGIIRHLLSGVFGFFVTKGVVTGEQAEQTIGALVLFIATLAWSLYQKWATQPEGKE